MDRNTKLFSGLRQSKAALQQAFYRSLDSSLIRSGIVHGPAARLWSKIGEGRHFQCFRQPNYGGLDLCILLAKPAFLQQVSLSPKAWAADIRKLGTLDHPLVPPMEVIEDIEFFAYVQPFCEADLVLTPEIREVLRGLHENLRREGLELDDYQQLRSCQGHPFVIDFSELKRLPSRGFRL